MGLRLITPPTAEPVTLADVKADLRVDHTADDVRLARLIVEARQSVDGPATPFGRSLMSQTWELVLSGFPCGPIGLPTAPVQSVEFVRYRERDGAEQTADFTLDLSTEPPRLVPPAGWPAAETVRVRFVAGYETADDVPGPIKHAIRMKVEESYDGVDRSREIADALAPYRVFR